MTVQSRQVGRSTNLLNLRRPGAARCGFRAAAFWFAAAFALAAAGSLPAVTTPICTWTNVIGSPGVFGCDDGTGTTARLYNPWGLAVSRGTNIVIADTWNNTIRKAVLSGTNWVVTTLAGSAGSPGCEDGTGSAARFYWPRGVAVDSTGNLYVADTYNSTIRKVTAAGDVLTFAGSAGQSWHQDGTGTLARFSYPSGVATDKSGNVYVADTYTETIRRITTNGTVSTLAGHPGWGGSDDGTNGTARFSQPNGVTVDNAGNVYVADTGNCTIRKIDPTGMVTTLAGSPGQAGNNDGTNNTARFDQPVGVSADDAGNVYVADSNGRRIRKVTPQGAVITLAGGGMYAGSCEGTNATVQFGGPTGIAVDEEGNLYVADYPHHHISKGTMVGPVVETSGSLPKGRLGVDYEKSLDANGGKPPYTWSLASGSLPQGLTLSSDGVIAGVPLIPANCGFSLRVTGEDTVSSVAAFALLVAPPPAAVYAWTNFVGQPGVSGSSDGTGNMARLSGPAAVVIDSQGDLYVADCNNYVVRRVTPAGVVTTPAGVAGLWGYADGTNTEARFSSPICLGTYGSTNVYVGDAGINHVVRGITRCDTNWVTTTLAGSPGVYGNDDGTNGTARFTSPQGLTLDGAGNLYVTDNQAVRKITPDGTNWVVTTLAGRIDQTGNSDGTGTVARFNSPAGIAADGSGNLFVADYGNRTIRRVTATGEVTTIAGNPGVWGTGDGMDSQALFAAPRGMASDDGGNLYVTDSLANEIRKMSPVGTNWLVTTIGGGNGWMTGSADGTNAVARFSSPSGIAVDRSGQLYVADFNNHRISRGTPIHPPAIVTPSVLPMGTPYLPYSQQLTAVGGAQPYTWSIVSGALPPGLTLGPDCRISGTPGVSTNARFTVKVVGADGLSCTKTLRLTVRVLPAAMYSWTNFVGQPGCQGSSDGTGSSAYFNCPAHVAVDEDGNLFVADRLNNTIRKVTSSGEVTTVAGVPWSFGNSDGFGSSARFSNPHGLAVDCATNVYVADCNNHSIRRVSPDAYVTTLAGSMSWGSADGTGIVARFYNPAGVGVDSGGTLYIADSCNNTIRKMTQPGLNWQVSTLAGSSNSSGSADGGGWDARFCEPRDVAVDLQRQVYIADSQNHTIRRVTRSGVVSTIAGSVGTQGSADGAGDTARFRCPSGVATDSAGNIYVADTENHMVRRVTPAGVVTTLGGDTWMQLYGSADGTGTVARFYYPGGVAVDSAGVIYVADSSNHRISKGIPIYAPFVLTPDQLPSGMVVENYTQAIAAAGGKTPYSWAIVSNDLPSGLVFDGSSGAITGTPAVATVTNFRVRVTGADMLFTEQDFILEVRERPLTSWKTNNFTDEELADPEIGGDEADPDQDGIENVVEYALALDPNNDEGGGLPVGSVPEDYLTLTYRRNKEAADVIYVVDACSSLTAQDWSVDGLVEITCVDCGSYWLVTVRDSVPISSGVTRFMRLRVLVPQVSTGGP